ncbi:MAG: hypothetical protein MUF04_02430, partial [Akkermansiaceae bacterium]|nr:hypothetical protein [Akkermansiaceae bacterium]
MKRNPSLPKVLALVAWSGLFSSCATDTSTAGDPAYIGPFYGPEYDPYPYYGDAYWGGGVWVGGGGGGGVNRPSVPPPRPTHPIARPPMAPRPTPLPARGGR